MSKYLVNNKLGRIWKEAVLVLQWYYPTISMGGTWKTTKYLLKDSQCPSQDSNRAPPKFKSTLHQPARLLKYKSVQ